jgi:hypothetical protein
MEFEGVLLDTLLKSKNVSQWESELADKIGAVAGDDITLCLASYGYGNYSELQKSFADRYSELEEKYLVPVSRMPTDDRENRFSLWKSYRNSYMRYIKDGQS